MASERFPKKGKFSRKSKGKGELKNENKRFGESCDFPGGPDSMDRKYMGRYRKSKLGKQQYDGPDDEYGFGF